jgi:hypothetical protein
VKYRVERFDAGIAQHVRTLVERIARLVHQRSKQAADARVAFDEHDAVTEAAQYQRTGDASDATTDDYDVCHVE